MLIFLTMTAIIASTHSEALSYIFPYFQGNGETGLDLATSTDLIH